MTYVNKGSMTGIGILYPVLALLLLGIRYYGWRVAARRVEIDDVLIIPSALLICAGGIAMVVETQLGIIGEHSLPAISREHQRNMGKFEYGYWIGHVVAIGLIKLTLLFFFRRIFKGQGFRTAFDYANWTLIFLTAAWTVVSLFFTMFMCGGTPANVWNSLYSLRNYCLDSFALHTGLAVFSWFLDLAIFIEPLCMISSLNMRTRRKVQTSLVFLCSFFAVIAGLLRMIVWIQALVQGSNNAFTTVLGITLPTGDLEGIVSIALFWTYMETGVGFCVACLPPCAILLDKLSISPIMSIFRSLPSLLSAMRRSGGSISKEKHDLELNTLCAPESFHEDSGSFIADRRQEEAPSFR